MTLLQQQSSRSFAILVALGTVCLSAACLNDRDSEVIETRQHPGAAEIIVGRFERNPPEYYQTRVKRIQSAGGPKTLGEYDDLAVALGRLGHEDEAIKVIEAKAVAMKKSGSGAGTLDWYRYHANLGTFELGKWFLEGKNWSRIRDVKVARGHISEALKLNPTAHEGREGVQLGMMDWIISSANPAYRMSFADWLDKKKVDKDAEIRGLLGIIQLGGAWENVDIYQALEYCFESEGSPVLAGFTIKRDLELEAEGKKSLVGTLIDASDPQATTAWISENYREWRANANRFSSTRNAFMLAKLTGGSHPDTDPHFWDGYKEVPPASWTPDGFDALNRFLSLAGWTYLGLFIFTVVIVWRLSGRNRNRGPFDT